MREFNKITKVSNTFVVPQEVWVNTLQDMKCTLELISYYIKINEPEKAQEYIKEYIEKIKTAHNAEMPVNEFMALVINRLNCFEQE